MQTRGLAGRHYWLDPRRHEQQVNQHKQQRQQETPTINKRVLPAVRHHAIKSPKSKHKHKHSCTHSSRP